MEQSLMIQDLSDEELEMVVGGHHHGHHGHHGHHHSGGNVTVINYYIIDSPGAQVITGVSNGSSESNNPTTVSAS